MNFRFTITKKISLGFGVITFISLFNSALIGYYIHESKNLNDTIHKVYQPSLQHLKELNNEVLESKILIKNWVFIEKDDFTSDKLRLIEIKDIRIPFLVKELKSLSTLYWANNEKESINEIISLLNDSLITYHSNIANNLNTKTAYADKVYLREVQRLAEESGSISLLTGIINAKLILLIEFYNTKVDQTRNRNDALYMKTLRVAVTFSILFIILAIVISYFTIRNLIKPINFIKNTLISMSKGILPNNKIKESNDEIGEMSGALNSLVQGLKDISDFATEIGKGNFNSSFTPLSDKDTLGNSLIMMREELIMASLEDEKRKKEDSQRNWATQGIAKFSEILRLNTDNLGELSYNVISNLVNYLDANQGGMFIITESNGNETLELTACYAYNRKKFLDKKIEKGEGLVGRCFQEKETIYMSEIPKDYIKITSGLGEENPRSLLLVPLTSNDETYGVIELASFAELEVFQIEFVEKIATSIASTISTVKINIQTNKLLSQSRLQAEEKSSQEEEMRQNMEELRATQEQSARREQQLLKEVEMLKTELSKYTL